MWFSQILAKFAVSLFTREWIEISRNGRNSRLNTVSLFTREWIEILNNAASVLPEIASPSLRGSGLKSPSLAAVELQLLSPSLRGSGLKLLPDIWLDWCAWRLPLYEGVDWNSQQHGSFKQPFGLPLYEGVDWNHHCLHHAHSAYCLPLYEGVDWSLILILWQKLKESPSYKKNELTETNIIF